MFAFEDGDPSVVVFPVAVGDVIGDGFAGGVPVGVVAVLEYELLNRPEVAFDPVQVAGIGRGRDQLDLVRLREGADLWGSVR